MTIALEKKGRPKRRWEDCVKEDVREKDAQGRKLWGNRILTAYEPTDQSYVPLPQLFSLSNGQAFAIKNREEILNLTKEIFNYLSKLSITKTSASLKSSSLKRVC